MLAVARGARRSAAGSARPLERLAAAASRLGDGDFTVRARARAIPELDAVAAALDATAERLDDLVTRERAFSADASHQLRTPLAALRIELEAIELRGDPPPSCPAALDAGRSPAGDDRHPARRRTRRAAPRRGAADLAALLDEPRARWHGPLAAEGRPLRISVDGSARVRSRRSRVVGEILDVLLDNACRHGAGAVTVTVRDARRPARHRRRGRGPRLPGDPEDAFARRGESRDGHGIGLALARSLTQAEGGRLTATRAGQRPTVSLVLPSELGPD